MSDLISRKALIAEYDGVHVGPPGGARKLMEDAPSVEPDPKWILCDERMPEEREWIGTKKFGTTISDEVYVTFEDPEGERFTKHLQFQNGELSRYDKAFMDAWHNGAKPIAWMPLPECYRGGNVEQPDKKEE